MSQQGERGEIRIILIGNIWIGANPGVQDAISEEIEGLLHIEQIMITRQPAFGCGIKIGFG